MYWVWCQVGVSHLYLKYKNQYFSVDNMDWFLGSMISDLYMYIYIYYIFTTQPYYSYNDLQAK